MSDVMKNNNIVRVNKLYLFCLILLFLVLIIRVLYLCLIDFRVNDSTTDLYLPTKRKNNYFHSNASIYGGATFEVLYSMFGFKVGGYIKGINAEFNYVGNDGARNDIRLGYGFKLGRNWLLTPQVGYYRWSWWSWAQSDGYSKYYDDYGIPFGESFTGFYDQYQDWDFASGISLACRVQYCFSRYMSVAVTPVCYTGQRVDGEVEFSLIFTLPFTKK
jgi:hypothetical protein